MQSIASVERVERAFESDWFCEHCCALLVIPRNKFVAQISELLYSIKESILVCADGLLLLLVKRRCGKAPEHSHGEGRITCEKCLAGFAGTGFGVVDNIREHLRPCSEVIGLAAQTTGIMVVGIGMVLMTLFPNLVRHRSKEEKEADYQYRKAKDREFSERRARRDECHKRYLDKDWESRQARKEGDKLRRQGKDREAEDCFRDEDRSAAEAAAAYREYLSI